MSRLPPAIEYLSTLHEAGVVLPPGPLRVARCGDSAELTVALLELIRDGTPCADTSLWAAHLLDKDPVPEAGTLEILPDQRLLATLVTRLLSLVICRFDRADAEHAAA